MALSIITRVVFILAIVMMLQGAQDWKEGDLHFIGATADTHSGETSRQGQSVNPSLATMSWSVDTRGRFALALSFLRRP